MRHRLIRGIPIGLTLCCLLPAQAVDRTSFTVLGAESDAVPAPDVIGYLLTRWTPSELPATSSFPTPTDLAAVGWPITSSLARSDRVAVHQLPGVAGTPLCVVGRDTRSLRWLRRHRDRLHRAGALCVLVEARGPTELERIRQQAAPVPIEAWPFDAAARQFGLRSVPSLLLPEGGTP